MTEPLLRFSVVTLMMKLLARNNAGESDNMNTRCLNMSQGVFGEPSQPGLGKKALEKPLGWAFWWLGQAN